MNEPLPAPEPPPSDARSWLIEFGRSFVVWGIGVVAVVCLLNVGRGGMVGGHWELIPDNVRFFGNLDEFVASWLLLSVCRYFGLDLCGIFFPGRRRDA